MDIENNYDTTPINFDHSGVRVDRTIIIRDSKPLDDDLETTVERDFYTPPKPVWEGTKESKV